MPPPETPTTAILIDALNALFEAEQGSLFRFVGHGSPHLGRNTPPDVRHLLHTMAEASLRHAGELHRATESLGGHPSPRAARGGEEQYLAYLSLKFLLPKLADAKRLFITRYENALHAITQSDHTPPEIIALLTQHLEEHRQDLATLEHAAASLNPPKKI